MSFLSLLFNTILYQILVNSSMYEARWKEVYMNNNISISCEDVSDIQMCLLILRNSAPCMDKDKLDNLVDKLTALQISLKLDYPISIKDNSILI